MNKKIVVYIAGLAVLGLVSYKVYKANKDRIAPALQVQNALDRVLREDHEVKRQYDMVKEKQSNMILKVGSLGGQIEGLTSVASDGSLIITLDVDLINSKRDRIEPVLAHEIYHAYDAFFITGLNSWIYEANKEKNIQPWYKRPIEMRAIAEEDKARSYLIKNYPKEYRGMSSTRLHQNNR